jgi:hypothetical protein
MNIKSIDWNKSENHIGIIYIGIVPFFPCNYTVWQKDISEKVKCRGLDGTYTFNTLYDAFNFCEDDFKKRIIKILT